MNKYIAIAALLVTTSAIAHDYDVTGLNHVHETGISAVREQTAPVTSDGMTNLSDRNTLDTRSGSYAFAGAEGSARFATGGDGGHLWIVDSEECNVTAGDGKQTLPEGLQRLGDAEGIGPMYIVLNIGGMIHCDFVHALPSADVNISAFASSVNDYTTDDWNQGYWVVQSDTTLACQTAPAPGAHIGLWRMEFKGVQNIVFRGCHLYGMDISGNSAAIIRVIGAGSSTNLLFDRMAYMHNVDDLTLATMTFGNPGVLSYVSMTNSIIADSDAYSTNAESNPGSGTPSRYFHSTGSGCAAPKDFGMHQGIFLGILLITPIPQALALLQILPAKIQTRRG